MPASNPLFDQSQQPPKPKPQNAAAQPGGKGSNSSTEQAIEMIRAKISALYGQEPNAKQEAQEAELARPRSKHQEFMHKLSISGKSLAEIQTAWHDYYAKLPDQEKHEVWQEFYENHSKISKYAQKMPAAAPQPRVAHQGSQHHPKVEHAPHKVQPASVKPKKAANAKELKQQLLKKVNERTRLNQKHKHHLKSLGFGLSMGALTLLILLFGFFNERFIAPFVTPSRNVSSTPIITDVTKAETVSSASVVIVPKINIEIPVVYDEPSIDEAAVQRALERGVLHYPTTSNPGEQGNAVFFGHSSSNILNNGKYKFAFVLLNRLENSDTFMIQKDSKRYVYRVFEKRIVPPTEVSVLENRDRPTATLITCDPPGTATNRLIVVGEQISPDPNANVASTAVAQTASVPEVLPSDAPTLWSRFWSWISS